MQKNIFYYLNKLKNTETAQLWPWVDADSHYKRLRVQKSNQIYNSDRI